MKNTISETVLAMVITGTTKVETFQTENGFLDLRFGKCFYVEGHGDNFPMCKVTVTFWKKENNYSIDVVTSDDFMCLLSLHDLQSIEVVEELGKMFITDGIDYFKNR